MGEQEDPHTAQLANTMDEFSSSMNDCISQLTLELEKVQSSTGVTVTKLRTAMEMKQGLRLPTGDVPRLQAAWRQNWNLHNIRTRC
eukprot:4286614-Amphidinium_carterae.1